MRNAAFTLVLVWFVIVPFVHAENISEKVLDSVVGDQWIGSLTYTDFESGERTKIPSHVSISKVRENVYEFAYSYPEEPDASSKERLAIRDGGNKINNQTILSVEEAVDGSIRVVTRAKGSDNRKKAVLRYTYSFSPNSLSIQKEVSYDDGSEFFLRNRYDYRRSDDSGAQERESPKSTEPKE